MRKASVVVLILLSVTMAAGAVYYDTDGDGLSDGEEVFGPTSFKDPDTNGDGLSDGAPPSGDADGDGLSNSKEINGPTSPTDADTDNDGLSDRAELNGDTSPVSADTDGDGVSDGTEVNRNSSPVLVDTDGDGLNDSQEYDINTNPRSPDTDGDGLRDPLEIHLQTDPTKYTPNEGNDADEDGLSDTFEQRTPLDPRDPDTDGDGLPDGSEVYNTKQFPGADPLSKDVYVELDTQLAHFPSELEAKSNRLTDTEGYGFTIHIIHSERNITPKITGQIKPGERLRVSGAQFDNENKGYYHAIRVADVPDRNREIYGTLISRGDEMLIQNYYEVLFLHELGHILGLYPGVFDGIDSTKYSYKRYPSIMNYNPSPEKIPGAYSTGDAGPNDHNDWKVIYKNMNKTVNTTELEPQRHLNKTRPGEDSV